MNQQIYQTNEQYIMYIQKSFRYVIPLNNKKKKTQVNSVTKLITKHQKLNCDGKNSQSKFFLKKSLLNIKRKRKKQRQTTTRQSW